MKKRPMVLLLLLLFLLGFQRLFNQNASWFTVSNVSLFFVVVVVVVSTNQNPRQRKCDDNFQVIITFFFLRHLHFPSICLVDNKNWRKKSMKKKKYFGNIKWFDFLLTLSLSFCLCSALASYWPSCQCRRH